VSERAGRLRALSLREAVELLRGADAPERFSPLTGTPLLLVDLRRGERDAERSDLAAACDALARIPAPSVALRGRRPAPQTESLLAAFDVVVDCEEDAGVLARCIERNPLASMALVQLLRHGEGLGVEAGLVLESLVYATLQAGPEFAAWLAGREAKVKPPRAEPPVLIRRELDQLHLRLNRPERCNAFSAEMRDLLCEGLALALSDDSIEEVVLSGEGGSFCSGGDLDEFGSLPDPATAHAVRCTRSPGRLLADCSDRLRAHVHGTCVGAGIELPAFAGRLIVEGDASFQLPEVGMGLVPGAGGSVSLPRRIGRQRTAWLALSGASLDAETALGWGLVDEIRGRAA
jgi:enoyl-CoA hydratase